MRNIEHYKTDLGRLITDGSSLFHAIQFECYPDKFESQIKKLPRDEAEVILKELSRFDFRDKYQLWYSEALAVITFLLPDRLTDFVRLYEKPKHRKEITCANYVIEDCLQGLTITRSVTQEKIVGPDAAIPQFQQQLNILRSVQRRFESSLFDIRSVLQADLFDSELDAAVELNEKGFTRGAGAIAGVVLEKHLSQVCRNHGVSIGKKNPGLNDYNQALKDAHVLETADWRFIQHLGDLRNLCDHDKKKEPTKEQVSELISGVQKISKTLF